MTTRTTHPGGEAAQLQVVVPCPDLDAAIEFYTRGLGLRLDMIMPADAPHTAIVSGHGVRLRLERDGDAGAPTLHLQGGAGRWPDLADATPPEGIRLRRATPAATPLAAAPVGIVVGRNDADAWVRGRAGMDYRDLLPGRLGGRVIASHIRIATGGPVDDYVHFHDVALQLIYCRRGWVRVVYEDQGPPFVLQAGDCVLQPPGIRHRVLECSPGLEVIELACPAEHPTFRDHDMPLPTGRRRPRRRFGGQSFVRHVAEVAPWKRSRDRRSEYRDTGIGRATGNAARVRVVRALDGPARAGSLRTRAGWRVVVVLEGGVVLRHAAAGSLTLAAGDACAVPGHHAHAIDALPPAQWLDIDLAGP